MKIFKKLNVLLKQFLSKSPERAYQKIKGTDLKTGCLWTILDSIDRLWYRVSTNENF